MKRGNLAMTALAVFCLVGTACARLSGAQRDGTTQAPRPRTAIAVSVLTEGVYLVDPGTGRHEMIASGFLDFQAGGAVWAPDHRRLAYGNAGLLVVDAKNRRTRKLINGQAVSMPAWSPDGKTLAYGNGLSLWVTSVDKADPVRLDLPEWLAPLGLTWHPGPAIAFQGLELDCTQPQGCSSTERSEIWTIQPDGTGLEQITRVGHAEKPRWSPDGSRLLFIRKPLKGTKRPTELWVVGADGSGARRLGVPKGVDAADWSPDGRSIVFVRSAKATNKLQLWVAGTEGQNARPLGSQFGGTEATVDW